MKVRLIHVVLLLLASLACTDSTKKKPHRDPPHAHVTNDKAFHNGAASKHIKSEDGIGRGVDKYVYYSGSASHFPNKRHWVSFGDMWKSYEGWLHTYCSKHKWGKDNTKQEIEWIHEAIQKVAKASLVDHRFILAVVMQESGGCLRVPTTSNGVENPGLMQSHGGASFNPKKARESIFRMVQDGTQGTDSGDGLTQAINDSGDVYSASRIYNSGSIADSGNLSDGNGATPCYVSDIANRLTGWVSADSTCPGAA